MKLGHRPLIWKNGRVPSNTYKRHHPSGPGICRPAIPYITPSPKLRPNPPYIFLNHSLLRGQQGTSMLSFSSIRLQIV